MSNNYFKDKWTHQMYEKIKLVYPDDSDENIMLFVESLWDKNFDDPLCKVYNNYEKEEIDTSICKLINWIHDKNAITTESGSLFKQHHECFNPNTEILDGKLTERKVMKKEKFKYMTLADKETNNAKRREYAYLADKKDLAQLRCKVIANSEYGVSGLSSSWFFNMACASATTARGQALISTASNAFEDFMADNVKFTMMDEALMFINNIVNEPTFKKDEKWVEDVTKDELISRIQSKFLNSDECDINIIEKIVDNLSQTKRNRVYYKCNLYEFIRRSKKADQLLRNIITSNVEFVDPMNPPKEIEKDLDKLSEAVLEYVHYNYPHINRTLRLKTHKRKCVVVIDTDSNFLNLNPWVMFCEELLNKNYAKIKRRKFIDGRYVISSRNYNESKESAIEEQKAFRMIFTIIHIITLMITRVLDEFQLRSNLVPNSHGTTSMKNEFLYLTLLTSAAKKHYQGMVKVQEGNVFKKPKPDVKGMEYMKPSMAGETTRDYIKKLVFNDILLAKNQVPNVSDILDKLDKFEKDIERSVLAGEDRYIKTANIKSADAYKEAMSIGPYKAAYVWNYLYPDKEIELPGRAYIIKVNLIKPKDFAKLSVDNPEMFAKLMTLFENNEFIKRSGITNIALPIDEPMPKWLKPYINLDEIKANNLKLLLQVLNCLGVKTIYRTKSSQFFSNIIEI